MQDSNTKTDTNVDVVIVGAGAAGIGMAMELKLIPGLNYAVLEREQVGESFRRWPTQTRFITPSFNSNPFGLADLNAVDASSSPANFAGVEHLSGTQYADYLSHIVNTADLPVSCGVKVLDVYPTEYGDFRLFTSKGEIKTRFLIWACGEYQFPDLKPFPGGQWCLHYAHIEDWKDLELGHQTVIGGYESGVDAAFNLLKLGCQVRLLVRRRTWEIAEENDPSIVLSPYSCERLQKMQANDGLEIISEVDVTEVSAAAGGGYRIHAADGRHWDSKVPPVLGTGFLTGGGARQIAHLWKWGKNGQVSLSNIDESTLTPGLFLVGPQVRQDQRIYCFIYKFRQRFTAIAHEMAARLLLDPIQLDELADSWGPFGNAECCENCEC